MKSFFTLIFLFFLVLQTKSQSCDIQTPGIEASITNVVPGQITNLRFTVFNNANGSTCSYPVNSVLVSVSLPDNGLVYNGFVSPSNGIGPYFNWEYEPISKVFYGINHTAIGDAEGELDVTFSVLATTLPTYPQNRLIPINIIQNPAGPIFPSNIPTNDNGYTTITINAPLPIELSSFNAKNLSCNEIILNWETASEKNNDYLEVMRSLDGQTFVSLGKVKGSNKATGDVYSFLDNYDLLPNETYYYRLRQVDFDGKVEYHKIIAVRNVCSTLDLTVNIHPNPTLDVVNINLTGYAEQDLKVLIYDALGRVVDVNVESIGYGKNNYSLKLSLAGLPDGMYYLKVNSEVGVYKMVKISN